MDRRRVVEAGFVVLAIAAALQARTTTPGIAPAAACSCANDYPPHLQPFGGDVVVRPRNARLRFSPIWHLPDKPFYADWAKKNGLEGGTWNLVLRKADDPNAPPIEIEQRVVGDAEERTLEVWPKTPLAPKTKYTLDPKGTSPTEKNPWRLHGELTTGDAIDTKPPKWSKNPSAYYLATGELRKTSCSMNTPIVELRVDAKDESGNPEDLVVAVWPGPATDAPPTTLARINDKIAYLGRVGLCSEDDYHVPATLTHLTLRVIDLAGNMSDPRDVTVDPSLPPPPIPVSSDPGDPAPPSGCSRACGKH